MAFSFSGLFVDPTSGIAELISQNWPELNVIAIEQPISAVAVRMDRRHYDQVVEGIPGEVTRMVAGVSTQRPAARFLLLRTECWGGICGVGGQFIQNGSLIYQSAGEGALRRLIKYWGVDLGPAEIFEPLRRDFCWDQPGLLRDRRLR